MLLPNSSTDALSSPMHAALCADPVLASQCQRSAARVRIYDDRTAALHCSSALERSIGFVHLSCGHTRASPPSRMCICTSAVETFVFPIPAGCGRSAVIHHSRRRVREAPRPLCVEGTLGQLRLLVSLPGERTSVWHDKDAATVVRSDALCVVSLRSNV